VLLTRSRLCPGPKPGSSLHLHVLGTPPAFVLSQDQTLREELPQRVVRNSRSPSAAANYVTTGDDSESWVCPWKGQTLAPAARRRHEAGTDTASPTGKAGGDWSPMYTGGSEAQDGVNSGPPFEVLPERSVRATASNLDTLSRLIAQSKSVHAVEFSKTVAPLPGGESSSGGAPGSKEPVPGRTDEYSAPHRRRLRRRKQCGASFVRPDQDRTWTLTVRSRARSSKSISTICCQVPSASRASITGIVSDGPISAARRWAWELVSWLSRLCS
jgi:hypothetical protein